MTARITALDFKRPRTRARITRLGFDPDQYRWAVACRCQQLQRVVTSQSEARDIKYTHDNAHRRAEQAHPAGTARPQGGDPA